jgi:hypothetical protein
LIFLRIYFIIIHNYHDIKKKKFWQSSDPGFTGFS